jgi:hypothetical protein
MKQTLKGENMTIDVTYNPVEDNAIIVTRDYPGEPVYAFFPDERFHFTEGELPF